MNIPLKQRAFDFSLDQSKCHSNQDI